MSLADAHSCGRKPRAALCGWYGSPTRSPSMVAPCRHMRARTGSASVAFLAGARVVTTPSGYLREHMAPYRSELRLLPNAVDLTAYEYRQREAPRPSLMWLRAFHTIYNPTLAPRVLARLQADFPAIHLTMVGPDKGDGSLERVRDTALRERVMDRLDLPGGVPKSEVPAILNRGDVFLNTTNIDNTPISVLEAMACGLCVVSTDVDGIPFLLRDGVDSLLVPPDEVDAMAEAIRRVLVEPGLAARLSANGRANARAHDWTTILPQWEELLVELRGT